MKPARDALALALPTLLGFVLGGALTAALVARVLDPAPPPIRAKLEWLDAHGADYDTLFLGSSRIGRQVIPAVFDREAARLGLATHAFNLAEDALSPPEDAWVLERALAGRKAPLRFLIVECAAVKLGRGQHDLSTRALYWHDAPRLATLWRRVRAPRAASPERPASDDVVEKNRRLFLDHLRRFAWNALRLGRGAEWLDRALGVPGAEPRIASEQVGPPLEGFRPPPPKIRFEGARRAQYLARLEAIAAEGRRFELGDLESQAELLRKRDLAERHGARLVLVAPPMAEKTFVPAPEADIAFLDFSDPARFPELFALEHRADAEHLNETGAEIFSRRLAQGLAAALGREGAP
jgi:hypothetical protein